MKKTAQAWFTGAPTSGGGGASSASVLAEWNSYAAARSAEEEEGLGFDIEAAVRTANDKFAGTLNVFSKGVTELPGSFRSATSSVPSGKSLMYFGLLLASGIFLVFIAFTMFLPVMVLMPQKFAICFTLGSAFIVGSFFALKGAKYQLSHMASKERLPFTLGFVGSMIGTIYVSVVLHSYVLSVFFSVLQGSFALVFSGVYLFKKQKDIRIGKQKVVALAYYAISYFPGGSAGLKFLSSTFSSSVLKCFRR